MRSTELMRAQSRAASSELAPSSKKLSVSVGWVPVSSRKALVSNRCGSPAGAASTGSSTASMTAAAARSASARLSILPFALSGNRSSAWYRPGTR